MHAGFIINDQKISFEEAEKLAYSREIPYPVPYLRSLKHRDSKGPSASNAAFYCGRSLQLQQQNDYYIKPESGNASIRGTGIHNIMDQFTDEESKGKLLKGYLDFPDLPAPYNRYEFTGTPDHIDAKRGYCLDFKTKDYLPSDFKPNKDHIAQVSVYNWLWVQAGNEPLPKWELFYIDGKFPGATYYFSGDSIPLDYVESRLKTWIYPYALAQAEGVLMPVANAYHDRYVDKKSGRITNKRVAPCVYCPVLDICESKYNTDNPIQAV